jgi:hypothetical protein
MHVEGRTIHGTSDQIYCEPHPYQHCRDVITVFSSSAHNGRGEPITPGTGRSERACPTRFGGTTSLGIGGRVEARVGTSERDVYAMFIDV